MAYVVARKSETWEIRESHSTAMGPRGRTLATFRTFTPEILERAKSRSSRLLTSGELRKAALRAGAPVAASASDQAAGSLLGELAAGRGPRPVLRRLLLDTLAEDDAGMAHAAAAGDGTAFAGASERTAPAGAVLSDSARAAARWIAATQQQRGEALHDLLLLSDHLPSSRTRPRSSGVGGDSSAGAAAFPRLRSRPLTLQPSE